MRALTVQLIALVLVAGFGFADSITIGDQTFNDVYVREAGHYHFVQDPATGKVKSFRSTEVSSVIISPPSDRAAILAKWKEANARLRGIAPKKEEPESQPTASVPKAPSPKPPPAAAKDSVSVRETLKTKLPEHGLKHQVVDDHLSIRPIKEKDTAPKSRLQTKVYTPKAPSEATLPKIVVQSPAAAGSGASGRGTSGVQTGGGGGGATGSANANAGANPGGGNVQSAIPITNISQLFTTIDDRLVGETPAVIY